MKQRLLARRLLPPVLVSASILVGLGCGVVNPNLLGGNAAVQTPGLNGSIVILVINQTTVDAQANVTVTRTNGGSLDLNIPVLAGSHQAVTQDCEVNTIQVSQASYAGTNGAVVIPSSVSPVQVGSTLQCGGVVAVTITGAPPNVFLNVPSF